MTLSQDVKPEASHDQLIAFAEELAILCTKYGATPHDFAVLAFLASIQAQVNGKTT